MFAFLERYDQYAIAVRKQNKMIIKVFKILNTRH